ncbi:MAG: hypothetical protein ABJP79_09855 [Tateyamaria sp.]|uniref:hypothetical protein n=1 Tax=Tateyamaria sp. TaxID=1929288 RepID=UPI0032A02020
MPYLLNKNLDGPFVSVGVPFEHPHRSGFEGRMTRGVSPLRSSGATALDIFPDHFDARIGRGVDNLRHPITDEVTFDVLSKGPFTEYMIVSEKVHDILVPLIGEDAVFVETRILFGKTDDRKTLPGRWFVIDFLRQMNPILEDRSNALDVLYSKTPPKTPPVLYCYQSDVDGAHLWCGDGRKTGSNDLPDRFCGVDQVYLSDQVHDALAAADALRGWNAIPIEAISEDDTRAAPGSPQDLRQTHRSVGRGWAVAIGDLHSRSYSGDFDVVCRGDAQDVCQFYLDDDLPAYRFFSFGGCIFANPHLQEVLGGAHLFTKVVFYEDVELTKIRQDAVGFGVLTAPKAILEEIPGLSWTGRSGPHRQIELPGRGRMSFREHRAYQAFPLETHSVWDMGLGRVFMSDAVLHAMLSENLLGSAEASLEPIELYDLV